ncbi:MAG: 3-dehydroquinate synthase [Candidatus Zixiibacteriota bacterium]
MPVLKVNLKEQSYPVIIGTDNSERLAELIKKRKCAGRLIVFYDAQFYALHGKRLRRIIKTVQKDAFEMVLPRGEKVKKVETVTKLYDVLINRQIARDDFLLACGGGVTGDLVGFTAATILRGVSWGVLSTTLLSMADASIGGKTGVNHPQGKNLIGAFWQPDFVLCDTSYLATLPPRDLLSGLGEVLKCGGLTGEKMIDNLKEYLKKGDFYNIPALTRLVAQSAALKIELVTQDVRDKGQRMYLNFGHTFAHAIEKAADFGKITHGEAVILGLVGALEIGKLLKPETVKACDEYRTLVNNFLELVPYRKLDINKILNSMKVDKKRRGLKSRFVLLAKPGKPYIMDNIETSIIKKALKNVLMEHKQCGGQDAETFGG